MTTKSRVLIVGGGPAGLVIAIELGRRGVPCVVFDLGKEPPKFPKANSTTSRTMEHYRRLGLSAEIRTLGLPPDHPPDISYHTHFADYELARRHWPTWNELSANPRPNDPRWPTSEPMHRGQQTRVEAVLRRHAAELGVIDLRFGWRVDEVAETEAGVSCTASPVNSGPSETFEGDYLVGCDAARSIVRRYLGVEYEGHGAEDREFLGGRMLATWLRMPAFYDLAPERRSWQYWAMNPQRFGALVAIDGKGEFVLHTQLPKGVPGTMDFARDAVEITTGRKFDYEILGIAEWMAGFMLVAQRFSSKRMFLAGDAAHLFTPASGLGYNTSVDDASNLGWKLAAVCLGWGGPELLDSYGVERKPIAHRNTSFARNVAEYFRTIKMPAALEEAGSEGDAARTEFGTLLNEIGEKEFDTPGIHFGVFYKDSAIVTQEQGDPPPDDPHWYVPHARPGARAPHVWTADREALADHFGMDFTLMNLHGADTSAFEQAATALGVPLKVLRLDNDEVRRLYDADLVLIRPDQHIAWRGAASASDAKAIISRAVGF